MYNGIRTFVEGNWYRRAKYPSIVTMFENSRSVLTVSANQFSFNITGFIICDNNPVVIFPKNFVTSQATFKSDASLLLRTLLRYRMEKLHPVDERPFLNGSENNSNGRIIAAIALLNDYQNNGYLKRVKKVKATHSGGNIDWNATINKTMPVIVRGRPIYADPIVSKTAYNAHHIIIQIHKAVISECVDLWGWITGLSSKEPIYKIPCDIETAVHILTQELTVTYANREIEVLRNMIAYLKCKIGKKSLEHFEMLATPYFYYTWEYICSHIFENQYHSLSVILPQPEWKSTAGQYAISQRPDILFTQGNAFYIIDAKYYNYEKSLPGWQDTVKQIFYQYTIENGKSEAKQKALSHVDKIYNAFILPESTDIQIKELGFVEVDNVPGINKIYAYAINTRKAMSAYAGGLKSDLKLEVIRCLTS